MTITPINMTGLQFISSRFIGVVIGQKQKKKANAEYSVDTPLMATHTFRDSILPVGEVSG